MPEPDPVKVVSPAFPIVGVGASAGGIKALRDLLKTLPTEANFAIVLVQHFPRGQSSEFGRLIEKWVSLPVCHAEDGVRPEPNHIYIPSSDYILTIEEGVFRTRPADGGNCSPGLDTIDMFLESLAVDRGERSFAIILSGTGMDGTAGAVRIRQAGGIVIVQDPQTALHDGMPNAVISRGIADHVLPVDAMMQQLAACCSRSYERPASTLYWNSQISHTLDGIFQILREQAGFDFSGYKTSPLLWRIQHCMDSRRVRTFEDYLSLLQDDKAELDVLIKGIPIHVTEFFRDHDAWEVLTDQVLEPLISETDALRPIRAWTPACSTGEEAYSLAMLLSEQVEKKNDCPGFQVFATETSPEILVPASRGVFSERSLAAVSAERKARFFYCVDGAFRVKRSLREKMVFASQNLLTDPPFTTLDLVTCRNLLIYLKPGAVEEVLFRLHSSLRMGGYLFLGKGETVPSRLKGFEVVSGRWNIYRKVGPMSGITMKFPAPSRNSRYSGYAREFAQGAALEHFDLPSVLVDNDFRVLRIYGNTDSVLRLPPGEPTYDLLNLVPARLTEDIRTAAKNALSERRSVVVNGLPDRETDELTLSLRLTPLQTSDDAGPTRMLVSFIRDGNGALHGNDELGVAKNSDEFCDPRWVSEAARISQEEFDASREESQALNQELRASNEQLNVTNEDLNQANSLLKEKIDELELQSGVLFSAGVATLFLDRELRVRWFTPVISELFPLRPADIGRRITDLVPRFEDLRFISDLHEVMAADEPRESEVQTVEGKWFLRRIRPYLSRNSGAAVTFTEITGRKHAEDALRQNMAMQAFLLKLSDALRAGDDEDCVAELAVRLLGEELGLDRCYITAMQVEEDRVDVTHQFVRAGLAPMPATLHLSEVPAPLRGLFERTLVLDALANAPGLSELERQSLATLQFGAAVATRMRKDEKYPVHAIVAVSAESRHWTPGEVALIEAVSERAWTSMQRAGAEKRLRESQSWLEAQKDTFQLVLNGAALESALELLSRIAVRQFGDQVRCGFYLVNSNGTELHHLAGMPEAYARCVDGFKVGPDSLACGLAVFTGRPVITPDVLEEPLWKDWHWLAKDYDFRGCWSFPIETSEGTVVGTLAVYHKFPRAAGERDFEFASVLTSTAAIIISRHQEMSKLS